MIDPPGFIPTRQLREAFEREQREQGKPWRSKLGPIEPAASPSQTAEALMTKQFAPIKSVVPDVFVEGFTLFAGKPKIGKSWLLLHVAIAVATGGFTLGDIHCIEGDVLYCALEDNERRLKSRLGKLLGTRPGPKRLYLQTQTPRLAMGGLA